MDGDAGLQMDSDVEHEVMHGDLIEEEEGSDIFDTDSSCDRAGEEEENVLQRLNARSKLDGE